MERAEIRIATGDNEHAIADLKTAEPLIKERKPASLDSPRIMNWPANLTRRVVLPSPPVNRSAKSICRHVCGRAQSDRHSGGDRGGEQRRYRRGT